MSLQDEEAVRSIDLVALQQFCWNFRGAGSCEDVGSRSRYGRLVHVKTAEISFTSASGDERYGMLLLTCATCKLVILATHLATHFLAVGLLCASSCPSLNPFSPYSHPLVLSITPSRQRWPPEQTRFTTRHVSFSVAGILTGLL